MTAPTDNDTSSAAPTERRDAVGGSIDHEFIAALRVGIMRLSRRLQSERPTTDLTLTQLSVLGVLNAREEMTIGELANVERVKPPSMTRTVNHLEEAGLVKRCAHESDGRQVVVKVTDAARAVLLENRRLRDQWLADHLAALTDDERRALRQAAPILARLAAS